MKYPPSVLGPLTRFAAPLVLASSLAAQTASPPAPPATPPVTTTKVTAPTRAVLDLPRLKTRKTAGDLPRLARTKVTVDNLLPQGAAGGTATTRQNFNYLALASGAQWSRPLRGTGSGVTFVSFLAYGSEGTTFDIGGATIAIKPGTKAGYAQISITGSAAGSGATPYASLIKIEKHDGASLVALPVFTVRLDPTAGVWDLYAFQKLVAEDLPLAEVKGARQFAMKAGAQGAWVLGLVTSDENPLYVDANANGIDDTFEKAKRNGVLLTAAGADRTKLAQEWKESQRVADVKPWKIRRLVPDGTTHVQN